MSRTDLASGQVIRMSLLFRVQHLVLTVLLLVLAVTGFSLMYHENAFARFEAKASPERHNAGLAFGEERADPERPGDFVGYDDPADSGRDH